MTTSLVRVAAPGAVLARLGLERYRPTLAHASRLIAAAGVSMLAGLVLMPESRTPLGLSLQTDLSRRLFRVADDLSAWPGA